MHRLNPLTDCRWLTEHLIDLLSDCLSTRIICQMVGEEVKFAVYTQRLQKIGAKNIEIAFWVDYMYMHTQARTAHAQIQAHTSVFKVDSQTT